MVPIVPTVLINGQEGIATGFSTSTPCYRPAHVIQNVRRLIAGEDIVDMIPFFNGFSGRVTVEEGFYITHGVFDVKKGVVEITELPVGCSTTSYKEFLNKFIEESDEKISIEDSSTEKDVKFILKWSTNTNEDRDYDKMLKLSKKHSMSNMHLFS